MSGNLQKIEDLEDDLDQCREDLLDMAAHRDSLKKELAECHAVLGDRREESGERQVLARLRTGDGYVFDLRRDGTLGDGDMEWPNLRDFILAQTEGEDSMELWVSGGER